MDELVGGCLCGAIRYVARGTPINVYVCHCRICQKALGAAFNSRALFPREAVTISGQVATWDSSPDLERGFCSACGTTLFGARRSTGTIGLNLGSLDDPDACPAPTLQIWASMRQAWVRLEGVPATHEMP